jgi:glycosyltransferase involved in cell wall biosynthesis
MPVTPPLATPRCILLVADCIGGVWQYSLELAAGLAAHGVETVLAVAGPRPNAAQRAEAEGIPGLRLQLLEADLDWRASDERDLTPLRAQLVGLASEAEVDLIHLNGAALGDLPVAQPVVATQHSCLATWWQATRPGQALPQTWRWHRARMAAGLAAAAAVIVPSAAFADQLRQAYGPRIALDVVHNGRALRPRHVSPRRQAAVLIAGRLWDEAKNVRTLDAAAAGICWPVLAAGPTRGPNGQEVRLEHLVALGTLDGAALEDRLWRAPVFASLAVYEPFGLAVLEAALAGCALVLSDTATFRELWHDAALFVPADDPGAARDAINRLIVERDLRLRLGAGAQSRAGAYSSETCVCATLAVYRRVLEQAISRPVRQRVRAAG